MSTTSDSRIEVAFHGDEGVSVTTGPDHETAQLRRVLKELEAKGLVPIEEDDEPPEVLEDGSVRIWFVSNGAKVTTIPSLARRAGKQLATAGIAAVLITAGVQGTQMAMAEPEHTYQTLTDHRLIIERGVAYLAHPKGDTVHEGLDGTRERLKEVTNGPVPMYLLPTPKN